MIRIGGLQKTTLIDYPGRLAATVFLIGCNFRCPFCYSSELVLPELIREQPEISQKTFFDFLKERKGQLEGVVVCGGEPTVNGDLPEFLEKIQKMGYLLKLDTNGSNPKMLKELLDKKLLNYIAMDIKAPLRDYSKAAGAKVDGDKIRESVEIIKNSGLDYEFRTTVVPTLHEKKDIIQIAKEIAPAKKYFLQSFRPEKTVTPKFKKIKPFPNEYLLELKKEISSFFDLCQVRD